MGDPTVRYGEVARIIDAAKGAGVEKVGPNARLAPLRHASDITPITRAVQDPLNCYEGSVILRANF
jgi:hypothetical protein